MRGLALLMLLALALGACSRAQDSPASSRPVLREVSLPDISSAAEPVQAQIRQRYDALQAAIKRPAAQPELAAAYGEMGRILTAAEYYDAADACFSNARALAPGEMRWPYFLGHVSRLRNYPVTAASAFEEARMLAPTHVPTLVWLAEMHLVQSRPEQAEPLLNQARTLDASSGAVRFGLGRVALAKQDYAAAVEHLEAALAAAPAATRVHYPLALAYRGLGNRRKAEAHLQQRGEVDLPPVDPLLEGLAGLLQNAAAYETRGAAALDAGQWKDAADNLRKAVAIAPDNPFTRLNLGTSLYMLGDADGALEHYQAAVRLSPGQARAHFGIGVLMETRGQEAEAIGAFMSAVQADPGYVEARFSLANALRRNGRVAESLPHYEEILRANPAVSQASFGYAIALVRLGRFQEARARLERDVKAFPDQLGFPHALARLLAAAPDDRVRDGARAVTLVQNLLTAQRTPALAETMAMALAERGDFDKAIEWQRNAIELARQGGRAATPPRLAENLRLYERRQPCRTPWPDDDPVHSPAPAR
jgi:tetratricopeptide (TPR) repeat protein